MSALNVGTLNLGEATVDEVLELLDDVDLLAMQEASDRQDVTKALEAEGCPVLASRHPGGKATPITYNPDTLELVRVLDGSLMGRVWLGPGTGPDWLKPKRAYGAVFRHLETGRRVKVRNVHLNAGQSARRRRRIARRMVTRAVAFTGKPFRRRVDINLGDFNTAPTSATLDPLDAAGYRCNHLAIDYKPTHGAHWAPDQVWFRGKGVRALAHVTRKTSSDHRALVVALGLGRAR